MAHVFWLMAVAAALVNPVRVRRLDQTGAPQSPPPRTRLAVAAGVTVAGLAGVALLADPLLDAIDLSPPTAVIAAGMVVGLTAIVDFVRPGVDPSPEPTDRAGWVVPLLLPGILRPAAVILVLAVAAHVGVGAALAVAVATAAPGLTALRPAAARQTALEGVAWRACAALAAFGSVGLMVGGVFSI